MMPTRFRISAVEIHREQIRPITQSVHRLLRFFGERPAERSPDR